MGSNFGFKKSLGSNYSSVGIICAQKAINFSIPTKKVVAARHSVKSQVHVGKQPTKNQGKNRSAEDLALPNSKKRCKGHDIEKKQQRVDHQSESSE